MRHCSACQGRQKRHDNWQLLLCTAALMLDFSFAHPPHFICWRPYASEREASLSLQVRGTCPRCSLMPIYKGQHQQRPPEVLLHGKVQQEVESARKRGYSDNILPNRYTHSIAPAAPRHAGMVAKTVPKTYPKQLIERAKRVHRNGAGIPRVREAASSPCQLLWAVHSRSPSVHA